MALETAWKGVGDWLMKLSPSSKIGEGSGGWEDPPGGMCLTGTGESGSSSYSAIIIFHRIHLERTT